MTRGAIRAWFVVHTWTSLACTAFLLLLCVTGLPLIFHAEIDGWLDPPKPLAVLPAGTRPLALDRLVARAVATQPGAVPLYLSFDDDRPVVNVTTGPRPDAPAAKMHFQSIDRRTGAVLSPRESGLMDTILRIHTDMLLGFWAELFLGAMGVMFVAAIVSGIVLYAPFMAKLDFGTLRSGRTRRLGWLDRHNLIGIATLAWALVVGATGTINTLVVPLTALWKADQLARIAHADAAPAVRPTASLQRAVDTVLAAAPGMRPQFVAFPGVAYSSHRHYAVFLQGATPLTAKLLTPGFVDATSGRLDALETMPWYMQALLLAQPLHFGDYGGLAMKIVWALFDAATIVVLGSGLYLWIARRGGHADQRLRDLLERAER